MEKHSGQVWCRIKKLIILNPKGWSSVDDFNHLLIDKEEFINRAASSTVKPAQKLSRREANKMLKKI